MTGHDNAEYRDTGYGFRWGAATVTRIAEHKGYVALGIEWESAGVEVWVSPTGRSGNVAVYERGQKIPAKDRPEGYWRPRKRVMDRWFPQRQKHPRPNGNSGVPE